MKINQIQRCTKDAAFPSSSSSSAVMIKGEFTSSSSPLSIFISSEEDRVKTKKIDSFMRRDLFYVSGYTARRRKKNSISFFTFDNCIVSRLYLSLFLSLASAVKVKSIDKILRKFNWMLVFHAVHSNFLYSLSHLDRRVLKRCTSCDAIHAEQWLYDRKEIEQSAILLHIEHLIILSVRVCVFARLSSHIPFHKMLLCSIESIFLLSLFFRKTNIVHKPPHAIQLSERCILVHMRKMIYEDGRCFYFSLSSTLRL